jgi:protein gp37
MSTKIQWTDETWNPTTGCTRVSEGCRHCYIERTLPFRMAGRKFVNGSTGMLLHHDRLDAPLHWKKPRRIFVNSMSDLFHPDIPADFIVQVFEVMAACPQHTFQILTKRPERIESVLYGEEGRFYLGGGDWLPNVWLGFSAEDQATFDQRKQVFAARLGEQISWAYAFNLWCSLEPLLGPIEIGPFFPFRWVVCGGESGPGARPCDLAWIRSIKDQCQAAGVPVFYKQGGASNRCAHDRKGGHFECFPSDLQIREYPNAVQRS